MSELGKNIEELAQQAVHDASTIEDMVAKLEGSSRKQRQLAAAVLDAISRIDASGLTAYTDQLADALNRPEAQTRWECLDTMTNIVPLESRLCDKAIPGAEGYPDFKMDKDFLDSQLKAMDKYPCAKYPGIEINYREGVVPTSPEYVTESLDAVMDHRFEGAVLSWNIMEAPDTHIACLGNR
jgi:hypothetical protein